VKNRFVLLVIVLAGCSNTQLKSNWSESGYSFRDLKNVLVLAVAPTDGSGARTAEDAFAKNIAKHNVRATPSYSLASQNAKLSQDDWRRIVSENGFDAVLVARLIDMKTVEREVPPTTVVHPGLPTHGYGAGWYGYYNSSYEMISQPGYTVKDKVAVIETKVYDAKSEKMIWAGSSDTKVDPDANRDALIRQFAKKVTDSIFERRK
jgi:hypothetical protein